MSSQGILIQGPFRTSYVTGQDGRVQTELCHERTNGGRDQDLRYRVQVRVPFNSISRRFKETNWKVTRKPARNLRKRIYNFGRS
ncbi:hypothetical protein TNCV_2623091 [Trichonephila clavipes]|nr:hypothetical protein TNCV_2623091 [Trichonephila clavipes]